MMSVVLQEKQSGKVFVYAKGSDMAMVRRVKNPEKEQGTLKYINEFARKGYRTLVFGMKEIQLQKEYKVDDIESDL